MRSPKSSSVPVFGYLSALESPEHGFFGGYLMVSRQGRPLEFHCTAPVRPSRAQQILYGPTLQPYLLGEQIGGTLLKSAELVPNVILTDQAAVLSLRARVSIPIVLLAGLEAAGEPRGSFSPLADESDHPLRRFALLGCMWELPIGYETERPAIEESLSQLARNVDLPEPFTRIHEAIREAQRIGSQGTDSHADAA